MADDDGLSGRLRGEFGCLSLGDLYMTLTALRGDNQAGRRWAKTLQSRFSGDRPLGGHTIGNLLIAGLWQQLNDPVTGLDMVEELLRTRGRVLPTGSVPLQIKADVLGLNPLAPDGLCTLAGQITVARTRATVQSVRLVPENPSTRPEAVATVRQADAIVLEPGSWLTSVIPRLLVPELHNMTLSTPARRILVVNITAANEANRFIASWHIELLVEHAPTPRLNLTLANVDFVGPDRHLIQFAASLGAELAVVDIRYRSGNVRHDPKRLADVYREFLAG